MNKTDLAFPFADFTQNHEGLTKREYIAAQVLNGLLANCVNGFPETIYTIKQSIEYTDELLKQLAE